MEFTISSLTTMSFCIKTPCRILFSGSSQSGKSTAASRLIKLSPFDKKFTNIYYFCSPDTKVPPLDENVKIMRNLNLKCIQPGSLAVFDDMYQALGNSEEFCSYMTTKSHHCDISIIIIQQNFFSSRECKYGNIISKNSDHVFLFKSPRENTTIRNLALQAEPTRWRQLVDAFQQSTATPYSYLHMDFSQSTPDVLRYKTNVLNENGSQFPIVFVLN